MKIHCDIAKDLMPLYIEDVLSDKSRSAVEEHLTDCEECRSYYRRMKEPDLPDSAPADDEVLSRLDEAKRLKALKHTMLFRKIVTIAVSAAAAFLILIAGYIAVFHYESYIPFEETGIRMTAAGEMFVDKPYCRYDGAYWGTDADGNKIAIFFLTSSYYSRHWEKAPEAKQHTISFNVEGDSDDYVDKVYYLPEKYVKENRLDGFFYKDNNLGDSERIYLLDDDEADAAWNRLISDIESEAPLVWEAK